MFMSEPINFIVTNVGKNALYLAQQNQVKLSLNKVGLGSGQYIAAADRVQMAAKFTENGIAAGSIETASFALRFTMIMSFAAEKTVSELGLYTSTGVLFAVASKPNGSYFKLYPGIDYVATFGLVIEQTVDPALIEFVVDGQGGLATQLMQDHLTAEDPHPQYKDYARITLEGHLAAADPHPQYPLKTFVAAEFKKIDDRINNLVGIAKLFFPPVLSVGTGVGADIYAERLKGHNYSLLDRTIVHLYCPEGVHEGWSVARETDKIKDSVFERSGTSRVGYSGRVGWATIDTERTLINKGFVNLDTQLYQEIKSGVIEVGENQAIYRESWESLDYTNENVILIISPEGVHEGWEIVRAKDQISFNVFNRSGTSRVGYSGRINWTLLKLNAVPNFEGEYPRQLTCGFANGSDFTIPVPANLDFQDTNYVPFITPESAHEGWSISRTAQGFKVNVFNRSGGNRIGYSGRVNWAVFAIKKPYKRTFYYKGQHDITVPASKTVIVDLFGPGGGGAGSIYSGGGSNPDGKDAGNSKLTYKDTVFIAGGGKKGIGGVWGNGSSYHNGQPGAAGINSVAGLTDEFELLANIPGNPGIVGSRWERQQGGAATSISSGLDKDNRGGLGGWGIGDEKWSYGGGGGSGGHIQLEFKNTSTNDAVLKLDVGGFGEGWKSGGYPGDDGGEGFAMVSTYL
jgi:hypothetical protein